MRTAKVFFLLMGAWGVANAETTPEDTRQWSVRFLRIEGAAVSVRRSADTVHEIGEKISNSNRLSSISSMRSAADELHRVVRSAELAVAVAVSDIDEN